MSMVETTFLKLPLHVRMSSGHRRHLSRFLAVHIDIISSLRRLILDTMRTFQWCSTHTLPTTITLVPHGWCLSFHMGSKSAVIEVEPFFGLCTVRFCCLITMAKLLSVIVAKIMFFHCLATTTLQCQHADWRLLLVKLSSYVQGSATSMLSISRTTTGTTLAPSILFSSLVIHTLNTARQFFPSAITNHIKSQQTMHRSKHSNSTQLQIARCSFLPISFHIQMNLTLLTPMTTFSFTMLLMKLRTRSTV